MKKILLLSVTILMLCSGCSDRPEYSKFISINGDWTYDDSLIYSFDVDSPSDVYDLFFSLDYLTDFGYENIYVKIKTEYPSDKSTEDVVSLNLTDGSGTFLGDCNSFSCDIDILLQEKFKFKENGNHVITISQYGRKDSLSGVRSGELKLYKRKS